MVGFQMKGLGSVKIERGIAVCKESSIRLPWASGFSSRAGGFSSLLARQASEVFGENVLGNLNYRPTVSERLHYCIHFIMLNQLIMLVRNFWGV